MAVPGNPNQLRPWLANLDHDTFNHRQINLLQLFKYVRKKGCWLYNSRLGKRFRVNRSTITRDLTYLKKLKLIRTTKRGSRHRLIFFIEYPSESAWKAALHKTLLGLLQAQNAPVDSNLSLSLLGTDRLKLGDSAESGKAGAGLPGGSTPPETPRAVQSNRSGIEQLVRPLSRQQLEELDLEPQAAQRIHQYLAGKFFDQGEEIGRAETLAWQAVRHRYPINKKPRDPGQ